MYCRQVRLHCTCRNPLIQPFAIVSRGSKIGCCTVISARPSGCMIDPVYTLIVVQKSISWKLEELKQNIAIYYERGGEEGILVYPRKVWETVSRYIEAVAEERPPPEPGLLLYGPPGTGKTAMLDFMADALGVHVTRIEQDNVLSMWVGESEKNLSAKLSEAEKMAPSIVLADEGEWLLARRNLGGTGDTRVTSNLVEILLRRLQHWKNKRYPVFMAVATNYSVKMLDPAFLRSGRFGKPVLVPLPDREAIEKIFEFYGVFDAIGRDEAEKYIRQLIALGANTSDVVNVAKAIVKGEKPRLQEVKGHGYKRLIPLSDVRPEEVSDAILCSQCVDNRASVAGRYRLSLPFYTGVAVAALWLLYSGFTPILVYNTMRLDEAIHMAEVMRSGLVVPLDYIHESEVRDLVDANAPIVYVSQRPIAVPAAELQVRDFSKIGRLVARFYGIEVSVGRAIAGIETIESMVAARLSVRE